MISEGKGIVSPARVRIPLTRALVNQFIDIAIEREKYRDYSKRKDVWGKGLIRGGAFALTDREVPASARPALIGLAGEFAVREALSSRLNEILAEYNSVRRAAVEKGVEKALPILNRHLAKLKSGTASDRAWLEAQDAMSGPGGIIERQREREGLCGHGVSPGLTPGISARSSA